MRALLFYAEQKEKRASKIKSKKYRKIRKKEKERHQEQLSLEQMDEADPEAADEERMKLERARAEERMSLRHKKGSKWARQLMKSEEMSEEVSCIMFFYSIGFLILSVDPGSTDRIPSSS